VREPPKVVGCIGRRLADDRHVQPAADDAGDIAKRHAVFGDAQPG
jgi:hypothetical protein